MPEYYITSQSSSNYINSDTILKGTTTVKDSFPTVISSSILKTSIPSTLSSTSPMSKINSSSIKIPSTFIQTNISTLANPSYSTSVKSPQIKTTIITTFLSTSHISTTGIQKTSSLYTFHSSLPISTLIANHESTNYIPNYSSSSIITSENSLSIYSSSISSSSIINKVKTTIPINTNIPSSSYDSFKSSIISYPTSNLNSYSFSALLQSFPISTSFIKESDILKTYLTTSIRTSIFTSLLSTSPKTSNLKSIKIDILSSVPSTKESNKNSSLIECDIISKEKKILQNNCLKNFIDYNLNQIKELGKDGLIINKVSDSNIYLYELESNIKETEYNNKSLIFIQKLELKSDLINKYNLNESENIYVLVVESPSQNENSAINDYDFAFFSENGTILNLSEINYDLYFIISIPIKALDLAHYEYAVYFSEFGYDIYEKNDI